MASTSRHALRGLPKAAAAASRARGTTRGSAPASNHGAPSPSPSVSPALASASPAATPAPAPTSASAAPPPSPPPIPSGETFAAETVPFVPDRSRVLLASDYVPAADYKAFALNTNVVNAYVTGQQNAEAAKKTAPD